MNKENGFENYFSTYMEFKNQQVDRIVSDSKMIGRHLEGAVERIEDLYDAAKRQGNTGALAIIGEARNQIYMERDHEVQSVMQRPYTENTIHSSDRPNEVLRLKTLIVGAVLTHGGRVQINDEKVAHMSKMSKDEIDQLDVVFVQDAIRNSGHIQIEQKAKRGNY